MIVEWSNPTSEVECAGVKCVVEPTDAAMGSGGETWTAAHLVRSSGTAYPIGLELRRNDANGALALEVSTHSVQPLYDVPLDSFGMTVDAEGELDWVGPSPTSGGFALMHYDRDGERVSSRWLLEHGETGAAKFSPHGFTLGYGYVTGVDASVDPHVVSWGGGIARFDADGRLVWSQTALAGSVVGVLSDGSTFVLGEVESETVLARLAPDGRVLWVRSSNEPVFAAMNPTNDQLVFGTSSSAGELTHAMDADGHALWRVLPTNVFGSNSLSVTGEGRIVHWHVYVGGMPYEAMLVIASDGSTCTHHTLPGDETNPTHAYAPISGERFAFTQTGLSGVMRLP